MSASKWGVWGTNSTEWTCWDTLHNFWESRDELVSYNSTENFPLPLMVGVWNRTGCWNSKTILVKRACSPALTAIRSAVLAKPCWGHQKMKATISVSHDFILLFPSLFHFFGVRHTSCHTEAWFSLLRAWKPQSKTSTSYETHKDSLWPGVPLVPHYRPKKPYSL